MSLMLAGATRVTVSFYESEARLRQRYTNFSCNASVLRALGATLLFEVDATDLRRTLTTALPLARTQPNPPSNNAAATCEAAGESTASTSTLTPSERQGQPQQQQQQYSRICFNFPQTGDSFPGSPNWHDDHATLLRAFFQSITEGKLLVGCCCNCNETPSESSSSSSTNDGGAASAPAPAAPPPSSSVLSPSLADWKSSPEMSSPDDAPPSATSTAQQRPPPCTLQGVP